MHEELAAHAAQSDHDWTQFGDIYATYAGPLVLLRYGAGAQFKPAAEWTPYERVARGLILRTDRQEVAAWPFPKFWNVGEVALPDAPLTEAVDKLDGSLGILYRTPQGPRIATRGSFTSDQAQWATDHLRTRYDLTGLDEAYTYLFEIIYPENRIVVNYGEQQGLTLLGVINRYTGEDYGLEVVSQHAARWGFAVPRALTGSLEAIIERARAYDLRAEGVVLRFADGTRLKVKGEAYMEAHRFLNGFGYQAVFDAMRAGTLDDLRAVAPAEWEAELEGYVAAVRVELDGLRARVEAAFAAAPEGDRKTFALWVLANHKDIAPLLFARLDGHDLTPALFTWLARA